MRYRLADCIKARLERRLAVRKACGNSRHRNVRPVQEINRLRHMFVINADRARRNPFILHAHGRQNFRVHRITRFGTQTIHLAAGIVTRQRGQIHQRNRLQQPCRLIIFLHGTTRAKFAGAFLHAIGIYANIIDQPQIQFHTGIAHNHMIVRNHRRQSVGYALK